MSEILERSSEDTSWLRITGKGSKDINIKVLKIKSREIVHRVRSEDTSVDKKFRVFWSYSKRV